MPTQQLRNYIGGRWSESASGQFLDVHNPSTGAVIARVPLSTPADVASAVSSAAEAFDSWSRTPVTARCDYTQSGHHARRFKLEAQAGMIGVNVGIPAPAACLPFGGMKEPQFADIKAQGKAAVRFYTEEKVITERYWPED